MREEGEKDTDERRESSGRAPRLGAPLRIWGPSRPWTPEGSVYITPDPCHIPSGHFSGLAFFSVHYLRLVTAKASGTKTFLPCKSRFGFACCNRALLHLERLGRRSRLSFGSIPIISHPLNSPRASRNHSPRMPHAADTKREESYHSHWCLGHEVPRLPLT